MTFSILPCRVTPAARSAHGAAVYNQKLWVFAGYDGSKSSFFLGGVALKGKGLVKQNFE
jgi:hypothetical protein